LEAVSRSNPEHVIGLFEHGVSSGRAYELLEYAPFGSLRDLYPAGNVVDTETVRLVVVELAEALHHLHGQGVIHRDLKPANVLVRCHRPFRPRADRLRHRVRQRTPPCTTPVLTARSRTPPRDHRRRGQRFASDYWSLGIIVCELVTGRHLLHGMTEIVMQARLVSRDVPTRQLPAPWDELCGGLLQRDPRARWQYDEIQAWLRGETSGKPGRRFTLPDINWRRVADAVPRFDLPRRGRRDQAGGARDGGDAAGPFTGGDRAPRPEPMPAREAVPHQDPAAAQRPYTFGTGRYATPAALAAALARNPSDAHKHVARGYVATWLADELRDFELANRVQDFAERFAANPELSVLAVTASLDPTHQAVFRGLPLEREMLAQALRETVLKPSRERLSAVGEIFEHDLVRLIAQARHDEELGTVADTWRLRWTALVSALSDLRPAMGVVHDVEPPEVARAMLLLASLDTDYVSQLKSTARRLLDGRRKELASGRKAIERYRNAHPDPVSVDVAIVALHGAKQAELDAGSESQRLLENAGSLDGAGVLRFLEAGASVDGPKPDDITPLMVAARHNGDVGAIQALLRAGANTEAGRRKGRTPLLVAARYNPSVDVIRSLLAAGADVHAVDRERRTALTRAARFNTNPGVLSDSRCRWGCHHAEPYTTWRRATRTPTCAVPRRHRSCPARNRARSTPRPAARETINAAHRLARRSASS
jgi:hypothetical protein